jgi:DNA adenine methylase
MFEAKPFMKWAGGKTQLLEKILGVFPAKIRTYYEPFVGGGAVFFKVATQKRFERAVINDWNQELVNCYRTIRDFPTDLIKQLTELRYDREVFANLRKLKPEDLEPVQRAARTIYLNKTGFNGLYRVNRAGAFNVPFGKFKTPPKIFEEGVIRGCSEALNDRFVSIQATDFAPICGDAEKGDLVYFDPPYVPVNATSDFTSYTSKGFGIEEQERLARLFTSLAKKGATVVLSNSDTELVRKLYAGFNLIEVLARRNINSKGDKRGPITELLVVG